MAGQNKKNYSKRLDLNKNRPRDEYKLYIFRYGIRSVCSNSVLLFKKKVASAPRKAANIAKHESLIQKKAELELHEIFVKSLPTDITTQEGIINCRLAIFFSKRDLQILSNRCLFFDTSSCHKPELSLYSLFPSPHPFFYYLLLSVVEGCNLCFCCGLVTTLFAHCGSLYKPPNMTKDPGRV